jgi:hypothetical protein
MQRLMDEQIASRSEGPVKPFSRPHLVEDGVDPFGTQALCPTMEFGLGSSPTSRLVKTLAGDFSPVDSIADRTLPNPLSPLKFGKHARAVA